MTDFVEQDLSGAHFERVNLRHARFEQVLLNDTTMRAVDLSGADIRAARLHGTRIRGAELHDVEISAELANVVVNGVDIAPLVERELNRLTPERAKMRPDTADGFREAWALLAPLWEGTIRRAQSLPAEAMHASVNGEWSFIETLRHLNFASAAWIGRMILGDPAPWHPLDLPWDEAPGWEGIPWDREAQPPLNVVLAVRAERQAMVSAVIASLTDEQLSSHVSQTAPGWPQSEAMPFKACLAIVLNEEWEHRRYADRDLTVLGAPEPG
jgi:uncharacterized damage-inducible protein DinB